MGETGDKLMEARCRLMVREPWYGHVAMSMEWVPNQMSWIPDENDRKLGIRIVQGGLIQVLYYPPYVAKHGLKELYGQVQHVIEHLVRLHPVRTGGREKRMWGVAADMSVNGKESNPRVGYKEKGKVLPPSGDVIYCPSDVDDTLSAEEYYKMLENNEMGKNGKKKGKGQGQQGQKGKGQGQKGQGQGQDQQDGEGEGDQQGGGNGGAPSDGFGKTTDDHSTWGQSDVSEDEARQLVKDICDQASQKSQGHVPGHLKEILKALEKPIVRWKELLRRLMGTYVGNRRWTNSRRNRRHDFFGKPGISHHAACTVSIVVDTSGSVSSKMLQQFFAEIEAVCYRAKVNVLQWDHAFQGFGRYRRGDWKRIQVRGRGGTDMAAPVKWLEDQGLIGNCCVMLTDGYCNWPEKKNFPMIFVIARERSGEVVKKPDWGHLVDMAVDA